MTRYRITVRGMGVELRGYTDTNLDEDQPTLADFAKAMEPFGVVVASVADPSYNPFEIDQPDHPPTPQASIDIIRGYWETFDQTEEFLSQIAMLHFAQANVIRGERGARVAAEKELFSRELHHFETEQENERLKIKLSEQALLMGRVRTARANHPEMKCPEHADDDPITCGWKAAVRDIDKVLETIE